MGLKIQLDKPAEKHDGVLEYVYSVSLFLLQPFINETWQMSFGNWREKKRYKSHYNKEWIELCNIFVSEAP